MKTRFAFVNGIWQLCMVTAALRQERRNNPSIEYQDYLILYALNNASAELLKFVQIVCHKFWEWESVICIEWNTSKWDKQIQKEKQYPAQQLFHHFNPCSIRDVDEIWLCKLQFRDERFFADIFNESQIVIYEDGLHTYAPSNYLMRFPKVQLKHPRATVVSYKNSVKNIVSGEINWAHQGIKRSHLKRVYKFYSVLGNQLPIPIPYKNLLIEFVDPLLLREFFSELYDRLQTQIHLELSQNTKYALLLGSNLSHLHSFPRQKELDLFIDVIYNLVKQDYKIIWKEHPRNPQPLFEDIKGSCDSSSIIYLSGEQKIPIEVIVSANKIDLCCSTLSSSLFYLRHIYGIKTVTCVKPLLQYLKGDFHKLSEQTLAYIGETTLYE